MKVLIFIQKCGRPALACLVSLQPAASSLARISPTTSSASLLGSIHRTGHTRGASKAVQHGRGKVRESREREKRGAEAPSARLAAVA